jgi:hypothetical protein
MPNLQPSHLPILFFGLADSWQQFRHQIPVVFGNGFVVERFNRVEMVTRIDSLTAFGFYLGCPFGSLAFLFRLSAPELLHLIGCCLIVPGSELLGCLNEAQFVTEPDKSYDITSLDAATETVELPLLKVDAKRSLALAVVETALRLSPATALAS